MHLVLVLVSGPQSEAAHTVRSLGAATLDAGHRLSVFCAGDGTAHTESLAPLAARGARVMWCTSDAAVRGWDRPGQPGRGSFADLGDISADADHLLVL